MYTGGNIVDEMLDMVSLFTNLANDIFDSVKNISFNKDNIIIHIGAFAAKELREFEEAIGGKEIIVSIDMHGGIQLIVSKV